MTEIQDWHRPTPQRQDRQAEARWGPRERTPRPAANSRAAPETRITPPRHHRQRWPPPHAGQGARSGKADTCLAQTSSGPMNMMLSRYGTRFNTTVFEVM